MASIFSLTALLLYLGASVTLVRGLLSGVRDTRARQFDLLLAYMAVIAHGLSLAPALLLEQAPNFALGNTLSLIAFLVMLLFLVARIFQPVHALGVMIFPSAFIGVAIAWLTPGPEYAVNLDGAAGLMHMTGAGLAYALLSLALAQAVLLHFYDRRLKNRQTSGIWNSLPPIQTMEQILFQLVYIGFALLSLTLISGALSSGQMFGQAFLFNHHTVLAVLAWVSLVALILGRHFLGWRGQIAILWTGAGFVLLGLGYFGTRFVLEVILKA